ncbi:leucine-rich repeat protein soc-2 [Halyomorpha halys]|uniref:leucine-rich repeat protein soc-2 n=1 Tax=Halyomorpha halys TaxID=286706 RepID=UPI0006D51999|nr:leucine-rich repeat-containing protein 30 [Halyomorpha halys]XP_014283868.1 leucine-rich repeat-containing protein 30 [Halyomorpha halys]XP_014283869.1 leucine-rich repeat-containing protein 30 [Halyomorpha halys]KAE8573800.1 hypothetical protein A483_HHAL012043 [Halyomorpha halys]
MPFNNAIALFQMHLIIERALASQSSSLYLCNLNLKDIPLSITRINHLLRLYLSHNRISQVPKEICQLEELYSLALDYNKLHSLPPYLISLQTLVKLNLNHNSLKVIPPEIFHLTNLEILWLNHTELSEIPCEIKNLTKLDTFGARGNNIQSLPDEFGCLENLRWLTLQDNKITHLPKNLYFTSLVHLNLSLNLFTVFPEALTKFKDMQFCFFAGNHIKSISDETLCQLRHLKLLDLHKNPLTEESDLKDYPFITTLCKGESDDDSNDEDDSEDWAESVGSSELNTSDEEDILDDLELVRGGAVLWVPLVSKLLACAY